MEIVVTKKEQVSKMVQRYGVMGQITYLFSAVRCLGRMGGRSATVVTSSLELDNTSRKIEKTHKW